MREIWKDVKGYEGLYQVSSMGKVKSLARLKQMPTGGFEVLAEILLSQKPNRGYMQVALCKNGKPKTTKVHRLVCSAFHQNPENKPDVNHKDCNKSNNLYSNLEWATKKENAVHATANGLHYYPDNNGLKNGRTKLSEQDVRLIRASKQSTRLLASAFDVSNVLISKIKNRKVWATLL